ncbi:MAG: toxic anion resistance protein [Tissierellia bacterium]|nr:toxic anion resistance protein [Bacillota bacterium]NLL22484.1 toxic anion resistance protein [Tissierellia bacterium]
MSSITLDDLYRNSGKNLQPTQDADTVVEEVKNELAVIEKEELKPEQRQRVDEIKHELDLLDSNQTVTFGVGAQRKLSDFSDTILNKIKNKDTGEVGVLLSDLLVNVKGLEIDELGESKGLLSNIPFISSISKKIERFKTKYENVEVQIDRIEGQLDKARIQMLKDIMMFDELYAKNLEYFNDLQLYIRAGEEIIDETRTITIPRIRQEAAESDNHMSAQLVSDFEDTVNRFEKKIHDLKLSKTMSIQTAPQIKLIQNNDKLLVDKIQTAILNTIPLWKSQIVIALGLARQESALKLQKEVSDTTNQLLLKNSEKLKQNTIEVAKELERGIIEIETLKQVNKDLIDTINETIKIQQEGRARREKAEEELMLIEGELKDSLLAARQR